MVYKFQDDVIAVVHDMAQESDPLRLTESELQLGKVRFIQISNSEYGNRATVTLPLSGRGLSYFFVFC